MELRYAISKKLPVLAFVISESAPWPANLIEPGHKARSALIKLKYFLKKERIVSFWNNKDELVSLFLSALSEAIYVSPRPGWVRADGPLNDQTLAEITRLSSENDHLRQEVAGLKSSADPRLRASLTASALSKIEVPLQVSKKDHSNGHIMVSMDEFLLVSGKDLSLGIELWM